MGPVNYLLVRSFCLFGASLFSQSLYMAFNGTLYDANLLLESAGPFAWIMIGPLGDS